MSFFKNQGSEDPWSSYGSDPSYYFGEQATSSLYPAQPVAQSPSFNAPQTTSFAPSPTQVTPQALPAQGSTLGPAPIQPALSQQNICEKTLVYRIIFF